MTDCECPGCGARLRNVEAGADGQVLCLNCGLRFRLGTAALAPVRAQTDEARRPPQAAGYGLSSLFGRALGLTAVLGAVVGVFTLMAGQGFPLYAVTGAVLLACGGLSGFACEVLGKTPERLDALLIRVAGQLGALPESLAPAPASSLPFILPFMLLGGLLVVVATGLLGGYSLASGEGETTDTCLLWLVGLVLFLAGLAMGDAQRFFQRAALLGTGVGRKVGGAGNPRPSAAHYLALAAMWVFVAVVPLSLTFFVPRYGGLEQVYLTVPLACMCYTLYRVSRLAAEAVGIWEAATERLGQGWTPETPWQGHWGTDFAVGVAYFCAFGIAWTPGFGNMPEALIFFGLCLMGVWLGRMLLLARRAERAAERLALHLSPPIPAGPGQDARAKVRGTWAFTALSVSAVAFFLVLLAAWWRRYPWQEPMLAALAVCYPMLWLAVLGASLTRSVGHLTRAAEGPHETKS